MTPLPDTILPDLRRQIERVRILHEEDLAVNCGEAYLPDALEKKYPNAACELIWQYLFPAPKRSLGPRSLAETPSPISALEMGEGRNGGIMRCHHLAPSGWQRAVKKSVQKADIQKRVSYHTLRHCFATHLLQNGGVYSERSRRDIQRLRF